MRYSFKSKSASQRREEVDTLTNSLMEKVKEKVSSGDIQGILDNISNFQYDYSLNNTLLIYMQNPEATTVGSYTSWQKVNRQVEAGEKGIKILCPVKYQKEIEAPVLDHDTKRPVLDSDGNALMEKKSIENIGFKVGYVFDISQTKQIEGKEVIPLEAVKNLTDDVGTQYKDLMQAISEAAPVPLEIGKIHNSANGYFSSSSQSIMVKEGMSEQQTLKTSIHETAHAILHNKEVDAGGKLSYFVAECGEFPERIGEYHDNLSVDEAVKIYKAIPEERLNAGKAIGVKVETEYGQASFNIVQHDSIQVEMINEISYLRENLDIQKAVNDLSEYYTQDNMSLPTMREIQAEGTAYVVARHYGIDTSPYSINYVATWAGLDTSKVMENLEAIKACSKEIIDRMDTCLERIASEREEISKNLDIEEMAASKDSFQSDEVLGLQSKVQSGEEVGREVETIRNYISAEAREENTIGNNSMNDGIVVDMSEARHLEEKDSEVGQEKEFSETKLAAGLDEFAKVHDPVGYRNAEAYPGSGYDRMLSELRAGHTEGIREYLSDAIEDGNSMAPEAKKLMSELESYENYSVESLGEDFTQEKGMKVR